MAKDVKRPRSGGNHGGKSGLMTGLLAGLVIGVAVAVGVAMFINRGASPFSDKVASATQAVVAQIPSAPEVLRPAGSGDNVPTVASTPASAPAQKASEGERFDFYTMLPGLSEKDGKQAKPAASKPASAPAKVETRAWLQAGSFQNEQDADNLKAKLALLGVEARIQTQEIPDKGLWHRVRVGPFTNPAEIDKIRAQLKTNGIESSVVKAN